MIFNALLLLTGAAAAAVAAGKGEVIDVTLSEFYSHQPALGKQFFDQFYIMNVTFGTPAQHFALLPDTGSPDTWVAGRRFPAPGVKFRPDDSSTFVNTTKPWLFEYGGPNQALLTFASGYAARDTVAILGGGGKALTLKDETFAVSTNSSRGQPPSLTEGIFGLTYSAHVSSYNKPVFFQEAIDRGIPKEPLFGIHLRRANDANVLPPKSSKAGVRPHGGKITFGGVDKSKFKGPIVYAPVQQRKGFWQIAIDGIYIEGKLVKGTAGFPAIVDTGTTIIVAPPKLTANFYKTLGVGTQVTKGPVQEFTVPCSTEIDISVKVAGRMVPIKAQDFNAGYADKSRKNCLTTLIGADATNASKNGTYPSRAKDVIVLGLPFILNTYAIFDYSHGGRIGLAKLVDDGKLPTVAPIDIAER